MLCGMIWMVSGSWVMKLERRKSDDKFDKGKGVKANVSGEEVRIIFDMLR